jgi:hypothetical protein
MAASSGLVSPEGLVVGWKAVFECKEKAERQAKAKDLSIQGVGGRVVRGNTPDHFVKLTRSHWKPFAWVFGGDGLEHLVAFLLISAKQFLLKIEKDTPLEMLYSLGFESRWIQAQIDTDQKFRLALFPMLDGRQATWDGIFGMIEDHLDAETSKKVLKWRDELVTMTFEEIQVRCFCELFCLGWRIFFGGFC